MSNYSGGNAMNDRQDLLNTWTEIAQYLDRGVRTVQRWETELGLPVHRPQGKERCAVSAIRAEIDEWLRACPVSAREGIPGDDGAAADNATRHPPSAGNAETQASDQILEARRLRAELQSLRRELRKVTGCVVDACQKLRPAKTHGALAAAIPHTVLVVDDNEIQSYGMAKTLRLAGFAVNSVFSGSSALAMMKESKPDAVVLDVNMPEMNGFEVCSRIREDPQNRDVPVIFYTSASAGNKAYAESLGATAFLTYPMNPEHLTNVLSTSIARNGR